MKLLFFLVLSTFNAFGQASPVIDPNKFTICAITINSDEEKKLFQDQATKHPAKFNPVVELTDLGNDEDWFKKACESKIRCDQLVISGHFGGEFFSDRPNQNKKLSLVDLESAGCSKTCEGILSDPYEVFLLGCNTLSGKDLDHRSPSEYLQVLLNDGFSATQAELVVQSRYGAVGDSHKGSMQRAFAGSRKNIYGFDSVGPSGKTIRPLLNNYFNKISLPTHLEKLQAKRMLNQVMGANKAIAESLKATAFAQCEEGSFDDPVTQKICKLQDDRESNTEKIAIMMEVLASDDYLLYLPAINHFLTFKSHSFTDKERADLKLIKDNKKIKSLILSLLEKTSSLGLKLEWSRFAQRLDYLSDKEASDLIKKHILQLFSKPLTLTERDILCSGDFYDFNLQLKEEDLKKSSIGRFEARALSCLQVSDPGLVNKLAEILEQSNDSELNFELIDFLADKGNVLVLNPRLIEKVKQQLRKKELWDRYIAIRFFLNIRPGDLDSREALRVILNQNGNIDIKKALMWDIKQMKIKDENILKLVSNMTKDKDLELRRFSYQALAEGKSKVPWLQDKFLSILVSKHPDSQDSDIRQSILNYFVSIKPLGPETLKQISSIKTQDPSFKRDLDYFFNSIKE